MSYKTSDLGPEFAYCVLCDEEVFRLDMDDHTGQHEMGTAAIAGLMKEAQQSALTGDGKYVHDQNDDLPQ